ncbi:Arf-GAP with SH3 domain, ANK repeat and PH domain-containing protein 2 [Galemys pyrenaicus]|uniref:Arf-GAP with SH3 domain, ANK repeat and PH domain-containing protein 2 n=1 Tax=Galemys pyrenaicus TaxID=202257 RepID=A0A8J6A675_GALPY|nr:Arf-GAP with SH3 domain, ANK repeat and PH domain-containing protein 2 [Galemys pyrenaicus]
MPDQISVSEFVAETHEDYKAPTASSFTTRTAQCRNTVAAIEEVSGAAAPRAGGGRRGAARAAGPRARALPPRPQPGKSFFPRRADAAGRALPTREPFVPFPLLGGDGRATTGLWPTPAPPECPQFLPGPLRRPLGPESPGARRSRTLAPAAFPGADHPTPGGVALPGGGLLDFGHLLCCHGTSSVVTSSWPATSQSLLQPLEGSTSLTCLLLRMTFQRGLYFLFVSLISSHSFRPGSTTPAPAAPVTVSVPLPVVTSDLDLTPSLQHSASPSGLCWWLRFLLDSHCLVVPMAAQVQAPCPHLTKDKLGLHFWKRTGAGSVSPDCGEQLIRAIAACLQGLSTRPRQKLPTRPRPTQASGWRRPGLL